MKYHDSMCPFAGYPDDAEGCEACQFIELIRVNLRADLAAQVEELAMDSEEGALLEYYEVLQIISGETE
jgi:hypothetical protein